MWVGQNLFGQKELQRTKCPMRRIGKSNVQRTSSNIDVLYIFIKSFFVTQHAEGKKAVIIGESSTRVVPAQILYMPNHDLYHELHDGYKILLYTILRNMQERKNTA